MSSPTTLRPQRSAADLRPDALLLALDMAATFVFAMEGAMAAIRGNLDFFGILVLSFCTALAGGVIRDVLVGAIPPASLRDWRYPTIAFVTGAGVFFFHQFVQEIPTPVLVTLDAAGLSLFAIAGTEKALNFGMNPLIASLMGAITGVGGGTVRDIFLAQVPTVLRSDVYAIAALAGAVVMIAGCRLGLGKTLSAAAGGLFCFLLRMISVWRHWNLPHVTGP